VEDAPEIDQRYKGEVCTHEDEVGLPLEVVDEGWCDHYYDEILRVLLVGGFQMVMWMEDLPRASSRRCRLLCPSLWRGEGGFLARIPWEMLTFRKD
jgi:hypothetical protein